MSTIKNAVAVTTSTTYTLDTDLLETLILNDLNLGEDETASVNFQVADVSATDSQYSRYELTGVTVHVTKTNKVKFGA